MPSMLVSKTFHFNSGHRIKDYDGVCRNVHGHNFKCIVNLHANEWIQTGMGTDFKAMSPIGQWLDQNLDHAFLYQQGDHVGDFLRQEGLKVYEFTLPPTTEVLAEHIFQKISLMGFPVHSIELRETPKCRVVYTG